MVKMIGILLIISSVVALLAGAVIDIKYGSENKSTGAVIANIFALPPPNVGFFGYLEAAAFSYSILSLIMGMLFLFRV